MKTPQRADSVTGPIGLLRTTAEWLEWSEEDK